MTDRTKLGMLMMAAAGLFDQRLLDDPPRSIGALSISFKMEDLLELHRTCLITRTKVIGKHTTEEKRRRTILTPKGKAIYEQLCKQADKDNADAGINDLPLGWQVL